MRQSTAAVGSAAFFAIAPGTVVGFVPWLITRWHVSDSLWQIVVGALLLIAGLIPLAFAFVEFAKAGGTPMPLAPTERLVITGFNRYVRNPMYVGLLLAILGQALLFGSVGLVIYAALVWVATASFVRWYEEPMCSHRYGSDYETYRRNVHAWIPRLRPWNPGVGRPDPKSCRRP